MCSKMFGKKKSPASEIEMHAPADDDWERKKKEADQYVLSLNSHVIPSFSSALIIFSLSGFSSEDKHQTVFGGRFGQASYTVDTNQP